MNWFIVIGCMHGDDEACALKFMALSVEDALQQFSDELRSYSELDGPAPEDGEGAVYIDSVYNCGTNEPMEVA